MTNQNNDIEFPIRSARRPLGRSIRRGWLRHCPQCGHGHIYRAFLKTSETCAHCGLNLSGHEADDAPPYFTIMIVGHIIVPLVLIVERAYAPELWIHATLFLILSVLLTLWTLPRVKGAIIGWQWALKMHGFANSATLQEDVK